MQQLPPAGEEDTTILVLTRNPGEKIFINGDEIKVTVVDVRGQQVRLGIEAPSTVTIDREEIYNKRQEDGNGTGNK